MWIGISLSPKTAVIVCKAMINPIPHAFPAISALIFASTLTILPVSSAQADSFVVGLGADNVSTDRGSESVALQLEYHFDPIRSYDWGHFNVAGIAETDDDGDIFAGVGLALTWNLNDNWFVESGLAAGYYDGSSSSYDLGGNVQFRTLIGLGYRINDRSTLSLAATHLSNAGIEDVNPGRNAIFLRYGRSF